MIGLCGLTVNTEETEEVGHVFCALVLHVWFKLLQ